MGSFAPIEVGPVVFHSSVTAKDLPELLFGGQQATSLNMMGIASFAGHTLSDHRS